MTKELIIFGSSPFIDEVDVPALIARYDTLGINHFADDFAVKYSFCLMQYLAPSFPSTQVFVHWQKELPEGVEGAIRIAAKPSLEPFVGDETIDGYPQMAWIGFTFGTALNWALREGYEKIYLIGIDHREDETNFETFHGKSDGRVRNILPAHHRVVKQFAVTCSQYAEIYQCNPNVKDDWQIPFKPISEL